MAPAKSRSSRRTTLRRRQHALPRRGDVCLPSCLSGRLTHMLRWLLLSWFAAGIPPCLRAAAKETCASCHEQPAKIKGSVHADLGCSTCHTDHEKYPHKKSAKPKCADCHEEIVAQHALSVHGQEIKKGNAGAPECSTCHGGVHEIKSTKSSRVPPGRAGNVRHVPRQTSPRSSRRACTGRRWPRASTKRRSATTATASTTSSASRTRNRR